MSLNYYKLYIEQIFQLAETIVIKSEDSAEIINNRIRLDYGESAVNPTDKKTWKYYLNISGKYHPTDTKIIITSLDTLQPIEFNAANLRIHTATAAAYEYGSRYYRELVSQYPSDYRQLILGMLYPVDIDKAIAAPDFSVLGYPAKYIEPNEETLIININKWLENFKTRWYNIQYQNSDKLYITTTLMIMYQQLVPLIITLRLRNCKTNEAHSYHIREYLASHGMLDEYLDFMTKKQALFFYRNINYIERNSGKTAIFDWLLDRILTERDIPVNEITLAQDNSELLTSYKPVARFAKTPINESNSSALSTTAFYTLAELLSKETNEAPGNAQYIKNNLGEIESKLTRSKTSFLKTKVLESNMIDYTDAGLYSIQDVALDLWCYMSVSNQYRAVINFTDTITGQDISIPNHVAFLYFLFAYAKVYDIPIKTIPEFCVTRVAIDPVPSIQDLQKVVAAKYITQNDLADLLSLHTPLETIISVTSFNDFIKRTLVSYKAQHMLAVTQNDMNRKGMFKNASYRLYQSARVASPYLGQPFETVFRDFGLRYNDLTKDEWANIYKDVYKQATGLDISQTESKAAMQQAMISLFKKLSSYSIQFLSDINKTTIRSLNWSAIRLGDINQYGRDFHNIKLSVFRLFKKLSTSKDYRFIELKQLLQKFYILTRNEVGFIDVTINTWQLPPVIKRIFKLNSVRLDTDKYLTCSLAYEDLPEVSGYKNLSLEEKKKIKDLFRNWVTDDDYIPKISIDDIEHIPKQLRTDFCYPPIQTLDGFEFKYIPGTFEFRVERSFTDLDAFYSNFGQLNSKAFKPFIKFHKNTKGFKISPGPVEMLAKSFKYTGGIKYNPGFGYSRDRSLDVELGDFSLHMPPSENIGSFIADYDNRILTFIHNTYYRGINLGNYSFKNYKETLSNFNLETSKTTIDPGKLIAGSLNIGKFRFNIQKDFSLNFVNVSSITTISPLNFESGTFNLGSFILNRGKETITMYFRYGKENLGTMQLFNDVRQVGSFNFIKDEQTLNNINFSAGGLILDKYVFDNLGIDLKTFTSIYDGEDLNKYRWSGSDVDNLINWPDNTVEEDFISSIIIPNENGTLDLEIINEDLEDFIIEEDLQELGNVTYDDVLKEINFID